MEARPLRILTAVAAYDGHDASVLALNRALLYGAEAVEVIYLGYNRTGEEISSAAIEEGVDAVAVSSYNGGHLQFYPHLLDLLASGGGEEIMVFGGGGGTILPEDARTLEEAGVGKIYGPGIPLDAVAADIIGRLAKKAGPHPPPSSETLASASFGEVKAISGLLGFIEHPPSAEPSESCLCISAGALTSPTKVVVLTGDGGSGKSTIIDELVRRALERLPDKRIAILACDPTTSVGDRPGAFLADRVRMNYIHDPRVMMRSVATGAPYAPLSPALPGMVELLRAARFDLVLVETPGSGQTGIDLKAISADLAVYVKTLEYGGSLQLEKDQLLRDADLVLLNKIDLVGAEAAFKELRSVLERRGEGRILYGLVAKAAGDPGMDGFFARFCRKLGWPSPEEELEKEIFGRAKSFSIVPSARRGHLAEAVKAVRNYDQWVRGQLGRLREDRGDLSRLAPPCRDLVENWPEKWRELSLQAGRGRGADLFTVTPNGLRLPKVALPDPEDSVESLRFLLEEGLPGMFPFATGIYPFRPLTSGETIRQFAGLRGPEETNRRLHTLCRGVPRPRLSIAFDGITLYGADSDEDPGSIGKIGEGGVPIDSWEDMKLLLKGFSVFEISTSMTINGPAPIILAMYFEAACEQERERVEKEGGGPLGEVEAEALREMTLRGLRGTVQADILKEEQAQNEAIFQTEFAIRLLGDVQAWFVERGIDKFYSLSISGYHIGEAGASPVQELAFTLANAFTYVENFLHRGMAIDDFAPNLSFFFKVSHEAEWLGYGAVCRKIWAVVLRDLYGAGLRGQRLKFHTQTSGRALQAEEWEIFNPIRQTYHALMGLLANANSLHVDSADEPMTTPGEKYVRQASLIPAYLLEEAEGFVVQNLLSGSYAFRHLMKEVQEGVLAELERIDQLGGVEPAMERGYQRSCIAESSQQYERQRRRPDANRPEAPLRPILGYNVHDLPEDHHEKYPPVGHLVRPDEKDWQRQVARVRDFRRRHEADAPIYRERLRQRALSGGNVFEELLETVKHATLGQITRTLAEVGGKYRKMV